MIRPERMPPHNADAEAALLGSALLDNALIDDLTPRVAPEDFFRKAHEAAWRAIVDLVDAGQPVDPLTLLGRLEALGEDVGGWEAVQGWIESAPAPANAAFYAGIVRQKATSRRLIDLGNRILRDGYSDQHDADELVGRAEADLARIADGTPRAELATLGDAIRDSLRRLDMRSRGDTPGVSTGFGALDAMIGGFRPAQLIVVGARPGMGKAQPLTARVLTPTGFVAMGSLGVGDLVIGLDGKPCRVIGVYPQGEKEVYRVTMSDGGSTECCAEHLWCTQTRNERRRGEIGTIKSLAEIMATIDRGGGSFAPNHAIPIVGPVEFEPIRRPSIDPYAMGVLLGDGCFVRGNVGVSNPEPDVIRRLSDRLPVGDAMVMAGGIDYRIKRRRRTNVISSTKQALVDCGLDDHASHQKFIPHEYLFGSVECRTLLLRGLCDTDGHVTSSGKSVEYSTSSGRLATEFRFLVRSLGGVVSLKQRTPTYTHAGEKRDGRISYRMVAYFPNGLVPVSSEKHLAKWKWDGSHSHRSIVSVEPVGIKPCRCIRVDSPDSLYVTDDFIVTHNTALALQLLESAAMLGRGSALFVSLEMGVGELGDRAVCAASGLSSAAFRGDAAIGRDLFSGRVEEMAGLPILIEETPGLTPSQVAATARRARRKGPLSLVVVDYLQIVGSDDRRASEYDRVGAASLALKNLSKQVQCPVVALSQVNRQVEDREDKRPKLADLRATGQIEQDADVVMFLYRGGYYDPAADQAAAELLVAKNRHGATGLVPLSWDGPLMRFANPEDDVDFGPAGGRPY